MTGSARLRPHPEQLRKDPEKRPLSLVQKGWRGMYQQRALQKPRGENTSGKTHRQENLD